MWLEPQTACTRTSNVFLKVSALSSFWRISRGTGESDCERMTDCGCIEAFHQIHHAVPILCCLHGAALRRIPSYHTKSHCRKLLQNKPYRILAKMKHSSFMHSCSHLRHHHCPFQPALPKYIDQYPPNKCTSTDLWTLSHSSCSSRVRISTLKQELSIGSASATILTAQSALTMPVSTSSISSKVVPVRDVMSKPRSTWSSPSTPIAIHEPPNFFYRKGELDRGLTALPISGKLPKGRNIEYNLEACVPKNECTQLKMKDRHGDRVDPAVLTVNGEETYKK